KRPPRNTALISDGIGRSSSSAAATVGAAVVGTSAALRLESNLSLTMAMDGITCDRGSRIQSEGSELAIGLPARRAGRRASGCHRQSRDGGAFLHIQELAKSIAPAG